MQIPARMLVEKMEEELCKLKQSLQSEAPSPTYKEQAAAIKTYCDLILSLDSYEQPGLSTTQQKEVAVKKKQSFPQMEEKLSPYDQDEKPSSDNLLDF